MGEDHLTVVFARNLAVHDGREHVDDFVPSRAQDGCAEHQVGLVGVQP